MKKIITILIAVFFTSTLTAQEKYSSYSNSYAGKSYNLELSLPAGGLFSLYINAMSMDRLYETGGLLIKERNHSSFISDIKAARQKYEEWVNVAKENNVAEEVEKRMAISSPAGAFFKMGNEWHFQFDINLQYDFKILESPDGPKYLLIVRTGKLKSTRNEYMTMNGFVLVFSNVNEIDSFLQAISVEEIEKFKNKPKAEDLFKD